jgi:glycosyltransferase involved in cell wall biosynthesis
LPKAGREAEHWSGEAQHKFYVAAVVSRVAGFAGDSAGEHAMNTHSSDARLRVVTLIRRLSPSGGAERLARQLTIGLDPHRFERTLCATRWRDSDESEPAMLALVEDLERNGVRFLGLKRRSKADLRAWAPLVALLRRERVDVLHAHDLGSNTWASVLGKLAGVPVVIGHEHGDRAMTAEKARWKHEMALRRLLDREVVARGTTAFVAVSRGDQRALSTVLRPDDPGRIVCIPNGIPVPLAVTGHDVRGELDIPADAPVVGAVSLLRPEKGVDVLIRAAALLAPRFPGLRVLVAGRGTSREPLERLIDELALKDVVVLLGRRGDVPDLLNAFDVAVLPSRREAMPLALLEYMESALPIVATRVGAVPDIITDDVHGLVVESGDPATIAAGVGELLTNRERAAALGRNARERVRSEFALDVMIRNTEALYEKLHRAAGGRVVHLAAA